MKREFHKLIQSVLNIFVVIMFSESQQIWNISNFWKEKKLTTLKRYCVLPIHWFGGNVTGSTYLKMLKEVVWPAVYGKIKKGLWFQKDGGRVHTAHNQLCL